MKIDTYCKIFIDAPIEYDAIFDKLSNYLCGTRQGRSAIQTAWGSISIEHNSYHIRDKYLIDKSDFVYWLYYIETESSDTVAFSEYVEDLIKLMTYLKTFCTGVVPSCDFEDML